MPDTDATKQENAHVVVEGAKAAVLIINEGGRRQSTSAEHGSASENTTHRTGPSLRQPVFS